MKHFYLRASAVQEAGTETGSTVAVGSEFKEATFILNVTSAATDAGDTLDVYIDVSPDAGTTWINAAHFTQVLGNGGAKKELVRIISAGALATPTAPLNIASDAASGAVRNVGLFDYVRYRGVAVNASTDNESFTYSLLASFR